MINFNLIARPMAEMVGGNNFIGSWRVADIAALVIILVEVSMGLFLMESLRITRLFPVIGALPDKWRVIMVWITLGLLTSLASVEAGLAYMREVLLAGRARHQRAAARRRRRAPRQPVHVDHHRGADGHGLHPALRADLRRDPARELRPLRCARSSACCSAGACAAWRRCCACSATAAAISAGCLVDLYDVVIFLPLWLEQQVKGHSASAAPPADRRQGPEPDRRGQSLKELP